MTHIKRIDEMAIRYTNVINKAYASKETNIKKAQKDANELVKKILKHRNDMIDVIDTAKYIHNKDLWGKINSLWDYGKNKPGIVLTSDYIDKNNRLYYIKFANIGTDMSLRDEKKDIYNAEICFQTISGLICKMNVNQGYNTAIQLSVDDIIQRSETDTYNNVYFLAYDGGHRYRINAEKFIDNLRIFADNIEQFLNDFFNQVQNLE